MTCVPSTIIVRFYKTKSFCLFYDAEGRLKARQIMSSGLLPFNLHEQASEKKHLSFNVLLLLLEIQLHLKNRLIF